MGFASGVAIFELDRKHLLLLADLEAGVRLYR